jgi:hypothetical protein
MKSRLLYEKLLLVSAADPPQFWFSDRVVWIHFQEQKSGLICGLEYCNAEIEGNLAGWWYSVLFDKHFYPKKLYEKVLRKT